MGGMSGGFQATGAGNSGAAFAAQQQQALGNYNAATGQQQQLAQALLNQSQGVGPNPAQMLTQSATQGAINQNQGMIASQKGISPAMAQRLGAQNAAQMSQQGAAQGSMLQAQQEMNAQQQYGQNIQQQAGNAASMYGTATNAINQSNSTQSGLQAQANAANQNMMGGLMQGVGTAGMMAAMKDGGQVQYLDDGDWVSSLESAASSAGDSIKQALGAPGVQQEDINKQTFLQTKSNDSDSDHKADGGPVRHFDQGSGPIQLNGTDTDLNALNNTQTSYASKQLGAQMNPTSKPSNPMGGAFQSDAGTQIANQMLAKAGVANYAPGITANQFSGLGQQAGQLMQQNNQNNQQFSDFDSAPNNPSVSSQDMSFASGGKVPRHLHIVANIYHGDRMNKMAPVEPNMPSTVAALKDRGGHVPGKAKVQGDSPKNDVVKTLLSPGEMVIPRSVMNSDDPIQNAAKFVADKLKEKSASNSQDFKMALRSAASNRRSR